MFSMPAGHPPHSHWKSLENFDEGDALYHCILSKFYVYLIEAKFGLNICSKRQVLESCNSQLLPSGGQLLPKGGPKEVTDRWNSGCTGRLRAVQWEKHYTFMPQQFDFTLLIWHNRPPALYRLIEKTHTGEKGPRTCFFVSGKAHTGSLYGFLPSADIGRVVHWFDMIDLTYWFNIII